MKDAISERRIFTVSELNQHSRLLLESAFPSVWVEGEISNFSAPGSGHWYFTLKDSAAQIRCAMFRNRNLRVRQSPKHGDHVLLRGGISLYPARGDYQMIVEHMEPAGLGALQRALEALKQKLAAEGLFAPERKRPLPQWPRHAAIVTSASGAALQDILHVLRRRYPVLQLSVLPVAVQGEGAATQIAAAIATANRFASTLEPPLDVLIVGRGGGSLEDLWAFNEERVARAIAASRIPVISAVGHETDVTIADLVADVRAPTPSAAAELVSPDGHRLLQLLATRSVRLQQLMRRELSRLGERLNWLQRRVRHPGARLRDQAQRLDELELRLRRQMSHLLRDRCARLERARTSLLTQSPRRRLGEHRRLLPLLKRRLLLRMRTELRLHGSQLQKAMQLLDSVSPLATLRRGYAIVSDESGRILRDASATHEGADIEARLEHGTLHCRVERVSG